jgi:hypothetical protein
MKAAIQAAEMDSIMDDGETNLDHRDMYFLWVLAERAADLTVRGGKFPRGCGEAQTLALLRARYLMSIPQHLADGTAEVKYEVTLKGQAAWKAYRFS